MAIPTTYKLDDGTLKIGSGLTQDISCQVTSVIAACAEQVKTSDEVPVLCGDALPAEDEVTYSWTLAFNVFQDLDAAAFVAYSWTNKGTEVPFEFVPSTDEGRKVTGTIRVAPVSVGGDVRTRPRADNTWQGKRGEDFILDDVA